jgi:cation diffusion facilitator family transporter
MHQHRVQQWQHSHSFDSSHRHGERRTRWVLLLTFTTMLVEIAAGVQFRSMALLADGWHMATHVLAFMIAIFAYRYSRVHADDQTFAFSSAKVGVLGGFASSIVLALIALMMIGESVQRLLQPQAIQFDDAILVASVGLLINLLSALLLNDHHHGHNQRDHDHDHDHDHGHHHDHNLRAAYLHVLADALTSLLAIVALLAGKFYGWIWMDALMGIVGALVIVVWALGLIKETSPVLLDQGIDFDSQQSIRQCLQQDGETQVTDLHVWRIGVAHYAAIISVVTRAPKSPYYYKALLGDFPVLQHVTIEVNACVGDDCLPHGH